MKSFSQFIKSFRTKLPDFRTHSKGKRVEVKMTQSMEQGGSYDHFQVYLDGKKIDNVSSNRMDNVITGSGDMPKKFVIHGGHISFYNDWQWSIDAKTIRRKLETIIR